MEWIDLTEKYPDELTNVLLYDKREGIYVGFYFSDLKCFIRDLDGKKLLDVTHFIPIPAAPFFTDH